MSRKILMRNQDTSNKSFSELYRDFESNNKLKNLSTYTIEYSYQSLKHFEQFIDEKGIVCFNDIIKQVFNEYILWQQQKYGNQISINTYLRAARSLMYYAMEQNLLPNSLVLHKVF